MPILRLIRFPNLLIVALTQSLLFFYILQPPLTKNGLTTALSTGQFVLFTLVTVIITATGYIINDVLDVEADTINKPRRRIVGIQLSMASALWLYVCLGLGGFLITLYLGFACERIPLISLYPLAFLLLFFYSAHWKKQALTGNLLIALFCAGVAGAVWLAEQHSLLELSRMAPHTAIRIRILLVWYMIFAFLSTLYREIVKDLEDETGDRLTRSRTAPIRWGSVVAKRIALAIGGLLLVFLIWQGFVFRPYFSFWVLVFAGVALLLPLLFSFFILAFAKKTKDYHRVSTVIKLIMLNGILTLLFANV